MNTEQFVASLPEAHDSILLHMHVEKAKTRLMGRRLVIISHNRIYVAKPHGSSFLLRRSLHFRSLVLLSTDTPNHPLLDTVHAQACKGPAGHGLLLVSDDGYWTRFLFDTLPDLTTFTTRLYSELESTLISAKKYIIRGPIPIPKSTSLVKKSPSFLISFISNNLFADSDPFNWNSIKDLQLVNLLVNIASNIKLRTSKREPLIPLSNSLIPFNCFKINSLFVELCALSLLDGISIDFSNSFENLFPNHLINQSNFDCDVVDDKLRKKSYNQVLSSLMSSTVPPRSIKLSNLTLSSTSDCTFAPTIPLRTFDNLITFSLKNITLPLVQKSNLLSCLVPCKNISTLVLRNCNLEDCNALLSLLNGIGGGLIDLDLSFNSFSARFTADLCGSLVQNCKKLTKFSIEHAHLDNSCMLKSLGMIKSLTSINFDGLLFSKANISELIKLIELLNLTSFSLIDTGVNEEVSVGLIEKMLEKIDSNHSSVSVLIGGVGLSPTSLQLFAGKLPGIFRGLTLNFGIKFPTARISPSDILTFITSLSTIELNSLSLINFPVQSFSQNSTVNLSVLNQISCKKLFFSVAKSSCLLVNQTLKQLLSLTTRLEVLSFCHQVTITQEIIDLLVNQIQSNLIDCFVIPPNRTVHSVNLGPLSHAISQNKNFIFLSPLFVSSSYSAIPPVLVEILSLCYSRLEKTKIPLSFVSDFHQNPLLRAIQTKVKVIQDEGPNTPIAIEYDYDEYEYDDEEEDN
ncbi:hypothetical protein RCL1_003102 [Eukaryota sp. TZLM3-RCL]